MIRRRPPAGSWFPVYRMMLAVLALVSFVLQATNAMTQDWPGWRGEGGIGEYKGPRLGLNWKDEIVRWKTKLPSGSNSSAAVSGNRVLVTASEREGKERCLYAFDRHDGSILWKRSVEFDATESTHTTNPPCSASPVTDGEVVCASFGSAGAIGSSMKGEVLWEIELGKLEHVFGNASSPVLYQDLCILWCGPGSRQFVLAVDKKTGKEVWRYDVPGGKPDYNSPSDCVGSWSTPLVIEIGGSHQLIVSVPEQLLSLDPSSGRLVWRCRGLGKLAYASPVVCDEIVISASGFHGPVVAVDATGRGDVTDSHVVWKLEDRQPQRIATPVVWNGRLYLIDENGVAVVIDAKTGDKLASPSRVCGQTWSSPVVAGNTLVTASLRGELSILDLENSLASLAKLKLSERIASSPSVSDGEVFIRGFEHLFCLDTKQRDRAGDVVEAE